MYNEIANNKRKTWILVSMFSLFTVALITLLGYLFGFGTYSSLTFAFIFSVLYSLGAFYFGDKIALASTKSQPIEKRDHPELYNLVENLSITAGIPTPKIYIINDPSPNAFATGRDPQHASVSFTTGILSILNKKELEGVVAHELSHIKNYDVRTMTIVVVLVGLIAIVSDVLMRMTFYSKFKDDNGRVPVILMFGLILVAAILSPLVAQVIKFAVSRSREFLADASGALLTRYPEGLASALQKIQTHGRPLQNVNHATAHLFISNPLDTEQKSTSVAWYNRLFMTHPPTEERIQKLLEMGR